MLRSAHQGELTEFTIVMSSFDLAWQLLGVATSWRVHLLVVLSVFLVRLFSRLFSVARVLFF